MRASFILGLRSAVVSYEYPLPFVRLSLRPFVHTGVSAAGSLTDAFIKSSYELAQNRSNPAPARMTDYQKREFLRDNVLPVVQ